MLRCKINQNTTVLVGYSTIVGHKRRSELNSLVIVALPINNYVEPMSEDVYKSISRCFSFYLNRTIYKKTFAEKCTLCDRVQ